MNSKNRKNFVLFILISIVLFQNCSDKTPYDKNTVITLHRYGKRKPDDLNEILWLSQKYNIKLIGMGCVLSNEEYLEEKNEHDNILTKYGQFFWKTVEIELDSIHKNNLNYKKAELDNLQKYLNVNGYTIMSPSSDYIDQPVAQVSLKLSASGKISNISLSLHGYSEIHFGKKTCKEFEFYLTTILEKAPLLKPSKFLNNPIEDNLRIEIMPLKKR
jgi:hypothetical protein